MFIVTLVSSLVVLLSILIISAAVLRALGVKLGAPFVVQMTITAAMVIFLPDLARAQEVGQVEPTAKWIYLAGALYGALQIIANAVTQVASPKTLIFRIAKAIISGAPRQ